MHATQKILIVGFGDVGERLAKLLQPKNNHYHIRLYALVRQAERANVARSIGAVPIMGDLSNHRTLKKLAGLANAVFYFAPPPNYGAHDSHTTHLLSALSCHFGKQSGMLPQQLIYISTTGVYGDCAGARIDETRPTNPGTDRAHRRVDAETQLRLWGVRNGVVVTILRAPGIYAEDRLPIARLKNGTPALNAQDDVYTNHIHAEDLARAALSAARLGLPNRIYNVVDDTDLKMGAYFDLVADHFKLPHAPRVGRAEAQARISTPMLSFMGESRRIGNDRLKRELKFQLAYPSVEYFLKKSIPA